MSIMFKIFPFLKRKDAKVRKVTLGICAMDKKAKSKPMREILQRLPEELFEIVYFGDEVILNAPIESWPVCEVLIAFYSNKFPTQKAMEYVKLRQPYMINDLEMDDTLKDRRKVYALLQKEGIYVPTHVIVSREGQENEDFVDPNVIEEFDDYVVINGIQINKPFVEKPVNAEDHNIYIYYPFSSGGGSKRLFRKIKDRSSEFYPQENVIRRIGSFIYEEFIHTQGTDVKVYTVGLDYGHAEARKSPVVDGRVKRDSDGLEVRYPVILSSVEKDIARKIVKAFRQTVCGFDILRVQGKSYCCDVNGFSFVKNSRKYYDDASQILTEIVLFKARPEYRCRQSTTVPMLRPVTVPIGTMDPKSSSARDKLISMMIPTAKKASDPQRRPSNASLSTMSGKMSNAFNFTGDGTPTAADDSGNELRPPSPTTLSEVSTHSTSDVMSHQKKPDGNSEELRAVIAVIRHGDRTPKQKIKIKVTHPMYLEFFHSYVSNSSKDLKVKSKSGLVAFLEVTRKVVSDKALDPDLRRKLTQVKDVLERWEISGINRKLQMKPSKWAEEEKKDGDSAATEPAAESSVPDQQLAFDKSADSGGQVSAKVSDGKGKEKKKKTADDGGDEAKKGPATEVLLILKWGGDLTSLGREQAESLGTQFRKDMYPDTQGGGVLRLHSTYRHDLKVRASDEGRVMKTAAAFTKGLLELEGQLTPILASLVTVEDKNKQMLDRGGNMMIQEDMDRCKEHLNLLQVDEILTEELVEKIAPECCKAIRESMLKLGNPLQTLKRIHFLIGLLCKYLEEKVLEEEIAALKALQSVASEVVQSVSEDAKLESKKFATDTSSTLVAATTLQPVASSSTVPFILESTSRSASTGAATPSSGAMVPEAQRKNSLDQSPDSLRPPLSSMLRISHPAGLSLPIAFGARENRGASTPTAVDPSPLPSGVQTPMMSEDTMCGWNESDVHPVLDSARPVGANTQIGQNSAQVVRLYNKETFGLMADRWSKLNKDFYTPKEGRYDLTKVPDVYDMVRYDCLHNSHAFATEDFMRELYDLAKLFENSVVPQEYGMDHADKLYIGSKMCGALLEKIRTDLLASRSTSESEDMRFQLDHSHAEDLAINSLGRAVRTRLYFTSESHLQTLLNVLRYPPDGDEPILDKAGLEALDSISELSYLTQICFRMFEDKCDPTLFRVEISLSPGATTDDIFSPKNLNLAPHVIISKSGSCDVLLNSIGMALSLAAVTKEELLDNSYDMGLSPLNYITTTEYSPNSKIRSNSQAAITRTLLIRETSATPTMKLDQVDEEPKSVTIETKCQTKQNGLTPNQQFFSDRKNIWF